MSCGYCKIWYCGDFCSCLCHESRQGNPEMKTSVLNWGRWLTLACMFKDRSRFSEEMAAAMAKQWGSC